MVIYVVCNHRLCNVNLNYKSNENNDFKREKIPLSVKGEEEARHLFDYEELKEVKKIYTSSYSSGIATGKYIAEALHLDMYVDERLNERKVGILGTKDLRMLKEMQEHDFTYKLNNGECLEEVKARVRAFLKEVLNNDKEGPILVVTHSATLLCLLSCFCEKGFNLENRLILEFRERVILDGAYHGMDLIRLEFDQEQLKDIVRL